MEIERKFLILVFGKEGVGKATLISKVLKYDYCIKSA